MSANRLRAKLFHAFRRPNDFPSGVLPAETTGEQKTRRTEAVGDNEDVPERGIQQATAGPKPALSLEQRWHLPGNDLRNPFGAFTYRNEAIG